MTVVKFRSKIDSWLLVLLIIAVAGQVFALIAVISGDGPASAKLVVVPITVLGVLLIGSIMLRTHYTVSSGRIRIVSGPFVWTIAISEIVNITESHSPWSSPALSLERLRITYSHNKQILVSPDDKKAFLKAVEENAT
jgi:hypothetical protein